jgi:hypothetical protein
MMPAIGKMLIILGGLIALAGVILLLAHKIPYIGRLPGDIYVKKENFTFYFPLTTCIVVSIILSLIFWLFRK